MKKNNLGFSLVELLAAIIILGVLMTAAVISMTRILDSSRKKKYISDAKELITFADYRIRNHTLKNVERPASGKAIVIRLDYLNNTDITLGPNGGEYNQEKSFVLLKNNGGELEYAILLVENLKKGGYKGISLTKEENLKNASIVSFEESELIDWNNIGTHTNGYSIAKQYPE